MTVGKWEERKGWKILLEAYYTEFYGVKDVTLLIRSSLQDKNWEEFSQFEKTFFATADRQL